MTKPKPHKPKRRKEEVHPRHEEVTLKEFNELLLKMVNTKPLKKKKK